MSLALETVAPVGHVHVWRLEPHVSRYSRGRCGCGAERDDFDNRPTKEDMPWGRPVEWNGQPHQKAWRPRRGDAA